MLVKEAPEITMWDHISSGSGFLSINMVKLIGPLGDLNSILDW